MEWLNEPPQWTRGGSTIRLEVEPETDFWRKTHDGCVRDNGHFYFERAAGDFSAQVRLSAEYSAQYDQAGLMVRLDETTWLKCGIEYVDGVQFASTVVTRDWSDWAVVPLGDPSGTTWRVTRHGGTFQVEYSMDGCAFRDFRQAYLTDAASVDVGLMACSPRGSGFAVTFENLSVVRGE